MADPGRPPNQASPNMQPAAPPAGASGPPDPNAEAVPVLTFTPVDSLTLIDIAALTGTAVEPTPQNTTNPLTALQNTIRAQLRQVLGLGQSSNRPAAPPNPPPPQPVNPPNTLNLSNLDEQVRAQIIQLLSQAQGLQGLNLQNSLNNSIQSSDNNSRTPLLHALDLSQQDATSQNQAMLQSVRAALEASFQQAQGSQNIAPVSNTPANFARASLNLEINPILLGSSQAKTREDYIFLADCSFRAHRHEELLAHVRAFLTVMEQRRDLVKDERYFIAVAYKDTIRGIRDAWRKVKKTEVEEKDAFKLRVSSKYRGELEDKMRMVCTEGLKVSSGLLTNTAVSPETRLYFCKVKGDLFRYMAEYSSGPQKAEAGSLGRSAYEEADRLKTCVSAVHPLRLGLALNFGVFLRDACQDSNRGWRVTKMALDEANRGFQMLAELDSNDYRESNGLLMNLRRNLMRWNTTDLDMESQENPAGGGNQTPGRR